MDTMLLAVDTTNKITNAKIEKLRAEQAKTAQQLADAERELEQLEHKAAHLAQSQSKATRSARMRRLIERGAIAEAFISNAEILTNDEFKAVLIRAFGASS